jgi:hypothetical protein
MSTQTPTARHFVGATGRKVFLGASDIKPGYYSEELSGATI